MAQARKKKQKGISVPTVRNILLTLTLLVAVIIAFWNMQPYIKIVKIVFLDSFEQSGIIGFFTNPVLEIVAVVSGIIIWALLQTAEVYPVIVRHDRRLLRTIALLNGDSDFLPESDDDDRFISQIKQWYNRFVSSQIRSMFNWKYFAYAIDATICIVVYPPVDGGIGQLFYVITTGQFGLINWGNVALIVAMLMCFELMVRTYLNLQFQKEILKERNDGR